MDRHNKTFCGEKKPDASVLTAAPARDIIIAKTRRVVCSVCGLPIGRVQEKANPEGALYYCRKCKGYRLAKVNTVSVP